MKIYSWYLAKIAMVVLALSWGSRGLASLAPEDCVGAHHGYIFDVEQEKNLRIVEMALVSKPEEDKGPSLREIIFTSKLSREFQERYERTFGYTATERNGTTPNRFSTQQYLPGERVSAQEDYRRKREFAQYMVKRLSEHHLDDYLKSSPSARPLYQFKERISSVNVEVKKGYKLNMRYTLSSNAMWFGVENPYEIRNRITFQMDPSGFGPGAITETYYHVGYTPVEGLKFDTYYEAQKRGFQFVTAKHLSGRFWGTLTGITREENDNEKRILVGVQW